jgi:hypothetical protein
VSAKTERPFRLQIRQDEGVVLDHGTGKTAMKRDSSIFFSRLLLTFRICTDMQILVPTLALVRLCICRGIVELSRHLCRPWRVPLRRNTRRSVSRFRYKGGRGGKYSPGGFCRYGLR